MCIETEVGITGCPLILKGKGEAMNAVRATAWAAAICLVFQLVAKAESSEISSVEVYAGRAEVTRKAGLAVISGRKILDFCGLPASLNDSSVQVWGEGSAEVTLEGVTVGAEPAPEVPEGEVAELREKLDKLEDERKVLNEKKKSAEKRIKMLGELKPEVPSSKESIELAGPGSIEDISKTMSEGLRGAYMEKRGLERKIADLDRRIDALKRELNRIQNPSGGRTKCVSVNISIARAGDMELNFSYLVPGAGWRPLYDIRALADEGEVEITGYAQIVQRTGEDWEDVKLSVSTARPQIGGTPPEFRPVYLAFVELARDKPRRAMRAEEELAEKAAPAPAEKKAEAQLATADVRTAGTAVAFEIKQEKTIPSDGEPHKVPISVESLEADFVRSAWPEVRQLAYLRTKVKNTTGHPFVGGKANVFMGPSFVGTTNIDNWADTEKKTISLGVDKGVRVERKLADKLEKEFFSTITTTYKYEIEVKNFKDKAVEMELFDRIPVSRHEDIEVKLKSMVPKPTEKQEDGIVKWEMNLGPGKSEKIVFSYEISYPDDARIFGLPE